MYIIYIYTCFKHKLNVYIYIYMYREIYVYLFTTHILGIQRKLHGIQSRNFGNYRRILMVPQNGRKLG